MSRNNSYIFGISAFYHDSAACLVRDGEIMAAAQEERFTRKKHDADFPHKAIEYCLKEAGAGRGEGIELLYEQRFPHSLGLLYSAFTYYLGFKVNSGEYKVMGLAPYGEPKYNDLIFNNLLDLKEDGSFKLNMKYFGYLDTLRMTNKNFDRLFGAPARRPETRLTQREMDIARSLQDVTEEIMLRMARHAHNITGMENLCLADSPTTSIKATTCGIRCHNVHTPLRRINEGSCYRSIWSGRWGDNAPCA